MVNISNRVKKALFEKDWTQKKLCSELGITENGLKKMMDSNRWKLETIEGMSKVFGLSMDYFISESEQKFDSFTGQDAYLREHLSQLEANFTRLSSQLERKDQQHEEEMRAKNQQIANLHDMLKMALGKPEGDIVRPLWPTGTSIAPECIETFFGEMIEPVLATA